MAYTVVLVEDELFMRKELAETTNWSSMNLILAGTAGDGLEGEAMIRSLDPDIVITDIRLPGIDGLEMLERCCVSHAVIISGFSEFKDMKRAIRLGVEDYILKPFDDEELKQTLLSLVKKMDEEKKEYDKLRTSMAEQTQQIPLVPTVGNFLIDSAIKYINENCSDAVGLREAADFLKVSESHLSRLFKDETGLNFLQYLNAYRINRSLEMLRDPKMNIGDISLGCGFPTPGYFAKVFKKFLGETPTQFRDKLGH